MTWRLFIEKVLGLLIPALKNITATTIIPWAIKQGYKAYEKIKNKVINSAVILVEKMENTTDSEKFDKHLDGIEKALKFFETAGKQLTEVAEILNQRVEALKREKYSAENA